MLAAYAAAVLLALALAMDAFAVALIQGARFRPAARGALSIGAVFGAFQGLMPLIGWGIGAVALVYVAAVDHWIAFGLLAFLGGRMIIGGNGEDDAAPRLAGMALLVAGVATSIDALAAGITLPTLGVAPLASRSVVKGACSTRSPRVQVICRPASITPARSRSSSSAARDSLNEDNIGNRAKPL